jgi:hypothetical protein
MITWEEFKSRNKNYGSRKFDSDDVYFRTWPFIDHPIDQGQFIMNQRQGWNSWKQPQAVDLSGSPVDPMNESETRSHHRVQNTLIIDDWATFDGFSLVLPNEPSPIYIQEKPFYLVVGIHNECRKKSFSTPEQCFYSEASVEWIADHISLGKPSYGLNPNNKGYYWIAYHDKPIEPRFKDKSVVFSYGGLVALTNFLKEKDDLIRPLSGLALKTLNTWSQEGNVKTWY